MLAVLLLSIGFNFTVGKALARTPSKALLSFGIVGNLAALTYYKYAHFLLTTIATWGDWQWTIPEIVLPLGISFFTFTQLAFLVDVYSGKAAEPNFMHYALFVTYFPHLIAGPVLHHREMMPQFAAPATYQMQWENLSVGLTLFSIGLFKKSVLADGVADFANPVFAAAEHGASLSFMTAWAGTLAYSLQLYFDFSGYSDMAIGLSRLFGIKLPGNFNSPYQAVNIIEFWRRWHMTLSRFLRDYLYIPLGGNRHGTGRRYVNLLLTMTLGGLWHGAGWTFIVWGAVHGILLSGNHAWHGLRRWLGQDLQHSSKWGRSASRGLTFILVSVAWVFFRANSLEAAFSQLQSMAGYAGIDLPANWLQALTDSQLASLQRLGIHFDGTLDYWQLGWLTSLCLIVCLFPNSQQFLAKYSPTLEPVISNTRWCWQPQKVYLGFTALVFIYALTEIGKLSDFLYFQF